MSALEDVLGRQAQAPPLPPAARRSWWLPLAIGVLLLACFAIATWERWLPARTVPVVRVVALEGDASAVATDSIAFQAAGWIEASPLPIQATTLVEGVVEAVLVQPGQEVLAGQELARLDCTFHRLDLEAARAAEAVAASRRDAAEAALDRLPAQRVRLEQDLVAARAHRDEVADEAQRLREGGAAIPAGSTRQAELRVFAHDAKVLAAEAMLQELSGEESILTAAAASAGNEHAAAVIDRRRAELVLERAVIRAPVAGIVMALHTAPGAKLMLDGMDDPLSGTVATLVDPNSLQARVDVALADAGGLAVGQRVRLSCEYLGERSFTGRVSQVVGQADLQRNTVQAKVVFDAPQPTLRPDMLVRAQFLGTSTPVASSGSGRLRLYLPRSALPAGGDTAQVWIIDGSGRAAQRTLRLGGMKEDHREVLEGLLAGEPVLVRPPVDLRPGERLRVATEDVP